SHTSSIELCCCHPPSRSMSFYVATMSLFYFSFLFFFNDTAPTEIYTLSLHDALPISPRVAGARAVDPVLPHLPRRAGDRADPVRSEEHTSELQSRSDLVCRLLLEKKKKKKK